MARKVREVPLSISKRLTRQLPKLSPLMREAFRSMWTDKQCEAWARKSKPSDVLAQSHDWLKVASSVLGQDDVPYSVQRLAWLAELSLHLEEELAGRPKPELLAAQQARDAALEESKQVRARLRSKMVLLVGGDEERGAALAIAGKGEVGLSLKLLHDLLTRWRRDARLRVLADELGLDESLLVRADGSMRLLHDSEVHAVSATQVHPALHVEGRVLRELRTLQLAFAAALEEGLKVPALKVRPALKALLSTKHEAPEEEKEDLRLRE